MPSALFVVSEQGYWGEECVEPLAALDDAGVEITVTTPTGAPPVIDERSIDPDEVGAATAAHVREVHETDERLADPIPIAAADVTEHAAVVFPGGHGTVWDVNQDSHARRLLREAVGGDGGHALVVCHAVGLLAFTRSRGQEGPLVAGRDVTGFPTEWEDDIVDEHDLLPDGRKLPYRVQEEVEDAGGNWDAQLDRDTSVRTDGDLVTARGPASSAEAARVLLDEMGVDIRA